MRTLKTLMALALIATCGFLAQAAVSQDTLEIVFAVGPTEKSPNYAKWLDNFESYLETGILKGGNAASDPTVVLLPNVVRPEYLMQSTNIPLWMGVTPPASLALSGERGNTTYPGVRVKSPGGMRFADLRIMWKSSDVYKDAPQNSLGVVYRFDATDYSARAVGKLWNNGKNRDGGVTPIVSGSPRQIVNELYFTGFSRQYMGNSQAELDNIRAYIAQQPAPFTITVTYDLLGENGVPVATTTKTLSVAPQVVMPRLVITRSADIIKITIRGDPSELFTIQSSLRVTDGWTDFVPLEGGGVITISDTVRNGFFRIK